MEIYDNHDYIDTHLVIFFKFVTSTSNLMSRYEIVEKSEFKVDHKCLSP